MQTALYKIELKHGRTYYVFCKNKKQIKDLVINCTTFKVQFTEVQAGIHDYKDFKDAFFN